MNCDQYGHCVVNKTNEVIIIYTKFYSLEPEKRERIINAALKEFARNGYEKASTNEIVKEAEISKGSLFSYFNSKKDLYLFLFDYVAEIINKVYEEIDWNETDLFERMRKIGLVKFKIYKKFPQVFDFLNAAAKEDAAEVKSDIKRIGKDVTSNGFELGYKNIDFTKFRDDMDMEKMMNIITWTILSFSEQQRERIDAFENIDTDVLGEWDEYFDVLKKCFYKKEGQ